MNLADAGLHINIFIKLIYLDYSLFKSEIWRVESFNNLIWTDAWLTCVLG